MEKVAIITDSSCDIEPVLLEKYEIYMLPLRIVFANEEFRDRLEITNTEIYSRMETELPTTSLPVPQDIIDLFESLKAKGYEKVLGIFLSSQLSGTYNVIKNIAKDYEKDLEMHIIDSGQVSMGLGYGVLAAAKALQDSQDIHKAIAAMEKTLDSISIYFVVGTLEYLRKGGRIGHVSGTIGEMLQIKPILKIEEGALAIEKKVKGRNKSIKTLMDLANEAVGQALKQVTIVHADDREEAVRVQAELESNQYIKDIRIIDVSAVLGVHTGRGLLGIISAPDFEY